MQFPLLKASLSWQGAMHFHYRDSNFTIAIIAILILTLSTSSTSPNRTMPSCGVLNVDPIIYSVLNVTGTSTRCTPS